VCAGTHGTRLLAARLLAARLAAARLAAARLLAAGCWLLAAGWLPVAEAGVAGPSADGHGYGASANNFYFFYDINRAWSPSRYQFES
jgi:hypothetical protein